MAKILMFANIAQRSASGATNLDRDDVVSLRGSFISKGLLRRLEDSLSNELASPVAQDSFYQALRMIENA